VYEKIIRKIVPEGINVIRTELDDNNLVVEKLDSL